MKRRRRPTVAAKDAEALRAGVSIYKPRSYEVLVSDAARSLACAIDDGKTCLEIEFPNVKQNFLRYKHATLPSIKRSGTSKKQAEKRRKLDEESLPQEQNDAAVDAKADED